MKSNIDLTEQRTFSRSLNHIETESFNIGHVGFTKDCGNSRFRQAIRTDHWTNRCLHKADIYFRSMGLSTFTLQCDLDKYIYAENVDIDGATHCICCGRTIFPHQEMCRRCKSEQSNYDRPMTRGEAESWPYMRGDQMKSDKVILYR